MAASEVTARLREMARLLAERGFVRKGIDMSPPAITGRLRMLGALSDMCRRLGSAGRRLEPVETNPSSRRV